MRYDEKKIHWSFQASQLESRVLAAAASNQSITKRLIKQLNSYIRVKKIIIIILTQRICSR